MATWTRVESFHKPAWDDEEVERERQYRLGRGAVSCSYVEDSREYTMTTVWQVLE